MARRDDGRQYMEQRTNFQRLQRQSTIQLMFQPIDVTTTQRYNSPLTIQPVGMKLCSIEALYGAL